MSYPLEKPCQIPEGNSQRVIFPLDRATLTLKTGHWNAKTMTSDRMTDEEFRLFMKEVKEYLAVYKQQFELLYSPKLTCIMILAFIALPYFPLFLCYLTALKKRATRHMIQTKQKLNGLAQITNMKLAQRDLMWVIPNEFPNWIELCTSARSQAGIQNIEAPVSTAIEMAPQQQVQYPGFQQYQYSPMQYQQYPQQYSQYPQYAPAMNTAQQTVQQTVQPQQVMVSPTTLKTKQRTKEHETVFG